MYLFLGYINISLPGTYVHYVHFYPGSSLLIFLYQIYTYQVGTYVRYYLIFLYQVRTYVLIDPRLYVCTLLSGIY